MKLYGLASEIPWAFGFCPSPPTWPGFKEIFFNLYYSVPHVLFMLFYFILTSVKEVLVSSDGSLGNWDPKELSDFPKLMRPT